MLQRFLGHAALGVSGLISVVPVAGSAPRKQMNDGRALAQIIKAEIEEARALPVNDSDRESRLRAQQGGERFQVKTGLEINPCGSELRRKIELLPEILR